MLSVGKCLKAHGIRGDIKVASYMDTPNSFCVLKRLIIDGKPYEVENARVLGGFPLIKLKNIDTMNDAENFREKEIFVARSDMPELEENVFYVDDLIGSTIILEGKALGKLTEINQYPSSDVYVISAKNKKITFPAAGGAVERVDAAEKKIYLNKQLFTETAVYED